MAARNRPAAAVEGTDRGVRSFIKSIAAATAGPANEVAEASARTLAAEQAVAAAIARWETIVKVDMDPVAILKVRGKCRRR